MNKITSPQELQAHLRSLLAYSQGSNPSRDKIARGLQNLADRLAAKAPAKLKGKKLDKAISDAYYRHFNRVQINMMDITKIYREAQQAYEGADTPEAAEAALDEAMKGMVSKYRQS
jgi:acyl-CoA-binding protein